MKEVETKIKGYRIKTVDLPSGIYYTLQRKSDGAYWDDLNSRWWRIPLYKRIRDRVFGQWVGVVNRSEASC